MRFALLASTCLATTAATSLLAETTIDTSTTIAVRTATANSGAADDVRITSAGSVVTTTPIPVTVDSANKLTNEGTIQVSNVDNAVGVLVDTASGSGIDNSGKIIVDETYTPADNDNDGDADEPFAIGTGRAGIRTSGDYTGSISNTGTITVEGRNSAGILLGGKLTGAFTHDGTTTVLGDSSTAIRLGDVVGGVRLAGTIGAQGEGAVAAHLAGDITGALVVQGTLTSTGYRATTAPSDLSKLDADDLLQGGSALIVGGDVSGGIILAVPPTDASTSDSDEDKDGIDDSKEGSASVISYGAAPAMQLGAAERAVAIGPVAASGSGYGLVIDGVVSGSGVYAGIEGTGLSLGGLGGAVSVAGGIGINGTVAASAVDASATAVKIGSLASTPVIQVAGTLSAAGGSTSGSVATALLVDEGGALPALRNSGTIKAVTGGSDASAVAILDRSGSLKLIENSGAITASGASSTSDRNVAIDLSAVAGGAIVRQTAVASGVTAPSITGDIHFGVGNDLLDIADGAVSGSVRFGGGSDRLALSGDATFAGTATFGSGADTVTLAGTSVMTGTIDFGGGADKLTITDTARFAGSLVHAQGLAVAVSGGTFEVSGAASIASLSVSNQGALAVTLDKSGGASTAIDVAGQADFAAGSKLVLKLAGTADAEGRYVVLRAGTLTGADNISASDTLLPFLYKGALASGASNEIAVDISRKTTVELGLNRSQAAAYDAVYAALAGDEKVAGAFLDITDGDAFRRQLRQMLPDHAGATFEAVTLGSRTLSHVLADPSAPFEDEGRWGYWISQVGWTRSKRLDQSAAYDVTGWGVMGGAEYKTAVGNFGLSLGYMYGNDDDVGTDNEVIANQFELAAYWRGSWDGFQAHARVGGARIGFDSTRRFNGSIGDEAVERKADADWNGTLFSASGGVSYQSWFGILSMRPIVAIDYYRLKEGGYSETGGGKAFDLTVGSRTSDEMAVTGSFALGLDFGAREQGQGWFLIELEGGRRQLVGGDLGVTTAHFEGGQSFTLVPEERTSGWIGKLRLAGGSANFQVGGEFAAEQQQHRAALSLRGSVQLQF